MRCHRNLIMARRIQSTSERNGSECGYPDTYMRVIYNASILSGHSLIHQSRGLWNKLIPRYPVGAKQIIVDPDYLSSFHRANVLLEDTPIKSLAEKSVKLKDGRIVPVDVVVFATGCSLEPEQLVIKGRKGKTIRQYFDEQGGPMVYLGCNFPGFPNLCYIIGTNAATGHASLLFDIEAQIQLAVQLARPIIQGKARSVGHESVTNDYNKWLQERIATSVWLACESCYYVDGTRNTKNIAMFPGPATLFWWLARKPRWEIGGEKEAEERWKSVKGAGLVGVLSVLVVWLAWAFY
ncbi:hypothetical protein D9758_007474 [Tetrapyrgos nigripes]|uniref:FAD/NAD(P)-binding domain-containing protein n=1 Tax=Tetrapyrgos nigripes TaxID=182062 RepID=A0A8H5LHR8_9AGAR|nr:hypothetical protein D9758_007474 [Tetrapyrgos nigripes]